MMLVLECIVRYDQIGLFGVSVHSNRPIIFWKNNKKYMSRGFGRNVPKVVHKSNHL